MRRTKLDFIVGPFNGLSDYSKGVALGQRHEDYAAGVRGAQPPRSEACGQKFGNCQLRGSRPTSLVS